MATTFNSDDFEAVNRYFMEQAKVKTGAAEKLKREWMQWWKENKREWTSYTQDEWDHVRNLRNQFNLANSTTTGEKQAVQHSMENALSSEELFGETRRAGTAGDYLEEPEPWVSTKTKALLMLGAGLVAVGVFGKTLLAMTPAAKLVKYLP